MTTSPLSATISVVCRHHSALMVKEGGSAFKWLMTYHLFDKKINPATRNISKISKRIDFSQLAMNPAFLLFLRRFPAAISYLNKCISRKGCCHGKCLTLIKLLSESPDLPCELLLLKLHSNMDRVIYYQYLEIIRGILGNEMAERNASITLQRELFPSQISISSYRYDDPQHSLEDLADFFMQEEENAWILRCWEATKPSKTAHSILICSSVKHQHNWFYNSKIGLFSFPEKALLKKGYTEHLQAIMPEIFKKKWIIHLEKYAIDQQFKAQASNS
jgi:hypothetical protein